MRGTVVVGATAQVSEPNHSTRVLELLGRRRLDAERNGIRWHRESLREQVATVEDPEDGTISRWELSRRS